MTCPQPSNGLGWVRRHLSAVGRHNLSASPTSNSVPGEIRCLRQTYFDRNIGNTAEILKCWVSMSSFEVIKKFLLQFPRVM